MHQCGPLRVHQFPCLQDNYGFLLRDEASGTVAAVDTPDAGRIIEEAESLGWSIDLVLNTHWHPDHTGGNEEVAKHYGCPVIAPEAEAEKIPFKDKTLRGGETVSVGGTTFQVLDVPGHTLGHIAYYSAEAQAAFVGDTVFSMGCGRMFEGTADVFWGSLETLRKLPAETLFFCAHEYTAANARFAISIDGDNRDLQQRVQEVEALRREGEPTVPVRLADELKINPFLRSDESAMAQSLGLPTSTAASEVFGELRRRKDNF
ncbi:MAG: hydroxyacylglutathione hydrolase [Pseudomonadota bacterium]